MQPRNPSREPKSSSQSLWLDRIERHLIDNKTLNRLIRDGALTGALSNLVALRKAITATDDYWAGIAELERRRASPEEVCERLLLYDVKRAAHAFRGLHHQSGGAEGYVSVGVSPRLAHDAETSINEARRLWKLIDRPNIMIAVAGTPAGIRAMQQLVTDGISVNVQPLFSLTRYAQAINAHATGLQKRLYAGKPIDHIAAVASFSPVALEHAVDTMLDVAIKANCRQAELVDLLHGQTGLACGALAYWQFQEYCHSPRWHALASRGAHKQRLLWITDANAPKVTLRYLDALMAEDTIGVVNVDAFECYRMRGNPRPVPQQAWAREHVSLLSQLNIELQSLERQLEDLAVDSAIKSYDELLGTLASKPPLFSRGQSP